MSDIFRKDGLSVGNSSRTAYESGIIRTERNFVEELNHVLSGSEKV